MSTAALIPCVVYGDSPDKMIRKSKNKWFSWVYWIAVRAIHRLIRTKSDNSEKLGTATAYWDGMAWWAWLGCREMRQRDRRITWQRLAVIGNLWWGLDGVLGWVGDVVRGYKKRIISSCSKIGACILHQSLHKVTAGNYPPSREDKSGHQSEVHS